VLSEVATLSKLVCPPALLMRSLWKLYVLEILLCYADLLILEYARQHAVLVNLKLSYVLLIESNVQSSVRIKIVVNQILSFCLAGSFNYDKVCWGFGQLKSCEV
jgi:hypothetical protein